MRVRVLGCSGGIGAVAGQRLLTTSLLVDDDVLIDAGTGVGELALDQLARIDHVFVTHSHLDHIAALPLMIDSVADLRDTPVIVHATSATLDILRNHVFNWAIWPDFSEISIRKSAVMQYQPLRLGEAVHLGQRTVTALPAAHTVPAVGYLLDSGAASLAFSGDTAANPALWRVLNAVHNLRYLLIETAFCEGEAALAEISMHLCPSRLVSELAQLERMAEVYITHLKPRSVAAIIDEIGALDSRFRPAALRHDQVFEF